MYALTSGIALTPDDLPTLLRHRHVTLLLIGKHKPATPKGPA